MDSDNKSDYGCDVDAVEGQKVIDESMTQDVSCIQEVLVTLENIVKLTGRVLSVFNQFVQESGI